MSWHEPRASRCGGLTPVVEDETLPEHDPDGPYFVLRQTEWYGQDCESWLQLVVKVSVFARDMRGGHS